MENVMYQYKTSLAALCFNSAELSRIATQIENGEVVDETALEDVCSKLTAAQSQFLAAKKELGYDDGLQFMQNANFAGFMIRNGVVEGDTKKLFCVARPFYQGFPAKANNYQFEVANLMLAYMQIEEKEAVKESRINFKNIISGVKMFFR